MTKNPEQIPLARFENHDQRYKLMLTAAMLGVAGILLPVYVYNAFTDERAVDFYANLGALLATIGAAVALFKNRWTLVCTFSAAIFALIYFSSLYDAKFSNNPTEFLWCLLVIPAITMTIGWRLASYVHVVILIISYWILFNLTPPQGETILASERINVLVTLVTMCLFSILIDRERHSNLKKIESERSKLSWLSDHDYLTGLYNRRGMESFIDNKPGRHANGFTAVIIADIDDFKKINDRFGHILGDDVVRQAAEFINSFFGPNAMVSRWGGEEFLVLLRDKDHSAAHSMAERLCREITQKPVKLQDNTIHLRLSCGLAMLDETSSVDDAIDLADSRLYLAKRRGKDQVVSGA